jgi:hypothetical protein
LTVIADTLECSPVELFGQEGELCSIEWSRDKGREAYVVLEAFAAIRTSLGRKRLLELMHALRGKNRS